MNAIIAILILSFWMPAVVFAKTITVTPKEAAVGFQVKHEDGYTVGRFKDFSATLELSDDQAQVVKVFAQIQTASIDTRGPARDEGLRSALFLDTAKFPQATFESASANGNQVEGTLTIKGISKPLTLSVEHAQGKIILKGSFDRNDFGITYNKVLPKKKKSVGDVVDLIVEIKSS